VAGNDNRRGECVAITVSGQGDGTLVCVDVGSYASCAEVPGLGSIGGSGVFSAGFASGALSSSLVFAFAWRLRQCIESPFAPTAAAIAFEDDDDDDLADLAEIAEPNIKDRRPRRRHKGEEGASSSNNAPSRRPPPAGTPAMQRAQRQRRRGQAGGHEDAVKDSRLAPPRAHLTAAEHQAIAAELWPPGEETDTGVDDQAHVKVQVHHPGLAQQLEPPMKPSKSIAKHDRRRGQSTKVMVKAGAVAADTLGRRSKWDAMDAALGHSLEEEAMAAHHYHCEEPPTTQCPPSRA